MTPTTLVAVRHGETEWNKLGRQQGHLDSPLTPAGRKQAEAMAAGLRSYRFDGFYSSDLGRARETADIVSRVINLEYETESALRERHLGILQGLTMEEFAARFPEEAERFRGHDPDYRLPGGESVHDRFERNVRGAERLAARHPGGVILVVAHGGVLMSFMQKALGLPLPGPRTYSLVNAAVNAFSIGENGGWRLETWGETAHLRLAGLTALDDM